MIIIRFRVLILFFFFFLFAPSAFAVTFTIENPQIDNEVINVTVSLSGLTSSSCASSSCYLQGGIKASSGGQYFGMTKNSKGDWHAYRSSPGKETIQNLFFSFFPTSGAWSGMLSLKVNPDDFGSYHGPDQYFMRVWRYSGKSDDYTDVANELTVNIVQPTLSPTLAPTNTPMPTSTPTNTQGPTSTVTPTPKPTNTSTSKPTEKKTPTPTSSSFEISTSSGQNREEGDILGAKEENTTTSSATMERAPSKKVFIITFLFIGIGCAGLSLAIVLRKQFFSS
ncbi:MAG: hypothetical protein UW37_C0018G0010 [Candidatus Gottesmanbacteria bacterium GW2011_GWA2_44_17]|uniref:Uncharacterized protein n=2 Tax=Candidatus Gottesmaniibacteriota TaxID=1752720 RepID=A0A0G1HIL8_9BACT|nr:MAG: hypothetical protein UW22_C0034G0010 [Candidatus Gottesmanbacteria bacterium GW2011_GWB1_44_11c]KKT46770.1 MAG: hypothetical protein UW37_C0018G0010 [Candidatus Gottesmanbacteria bacterium GW2011_GWA2_44_17]